MSISVGHDPVIVVENVSKRFHIQGRTPGDLREKLSARFRPRKGGGPEPRNDFWALKDISFTVAPGQPVGIVGHNGSGKSTMLKLLTGILKPTSGSLKVKGRVGALIEVGAGFHPDLTGRENIYLNGSILGLTRREVAKKFDAIVDFAGLAQFIDTPVKRYSSGMYMRLGFAIASQTDPEVLLIDEVLAVGDSLFQRKCLRRLKEFVTDGGALVFVSHAAGQVAELCSTCVWLDHGAVRFVGDTGSALEQYMAVVSERENAELMRTHPEEWAARESERLSAEEESRRLEEEAKWRAVMEAEEREEAERQEAERLAVQRAARRADPMGSGITGVTLRDARGIARTRLHAGEAVRVEIAYRFGRPLPDPIFGVDIFRGDGLHMFTTSTYDHRVSLKTLPLSGTLGVDIAALGLNEGQYRIQVNLFAHCSGADWWQHPVDVMAEAVRFEVDAGRFANGCVFLQTVWDSAEDGAAAALQPLLAESRSVAV